MPLWEKGENLTFIARESKSSPAASLLVLAGQSRSCLASPAPTGTLAASLATPPDTATLPGQDYKFYMSHHHHYTSSAESMIHQYLWQLGYILITRHMPLFTIAWNKTSKWICTAKVKELSFSVTVQLVVLFHLFICFPVFCCHFLKKLICSIMFVSRINICIDLKFNSNPLGFSPKS